MTPADLGELLVQHPRDTGLFLDFDGTLTPIVPDPTTPRLSDDLAGVLADLASRFAVVALVSGRPVSFLIERAAVGDARLLGLYGLQEWRDGEVRVRPEAAEWQGAVDEARRRATEAVADLEGVTVEDKGLSVALHWRNAPERDAAGRAVTAAALELAEATGLAREPGKFVEELRPPVAWDKGMAVTAIIKELSLRAAAYVGDDLGDLSAFAAVREAGGWAVAVDHGAETPPALLDGADVVLAGTGAVADWLRRLRDVIV